MTEDSKVATRPGAKVKAKAPAKSRGDRRRERDERIRQEERKRLLPIEDVRPAKRVFVIEDRKDRDAQPKGSGKSRDARRSGRGQAYAGLPDGASGHTPDGKPVCVACNKGDECKVNPCKLCHMCWWCGSMGHKGKDCSKTR